MLFRVNGYQGMRDPGARIVVAATGNIYAGLMYPVIVAGMTFVLGVLFLRDTRGRDIIN